MTRSGNRSSRSRPTPHNPQLLSDPTIYLRLEAIQVHGLVLKELIHEKFGDGIMSTINFRVDVGRLLGPTGDRVVITLDGKFLDYHWQIPTRPTRRPVSRRRGRPP